MLRKSSTGEKEIARRPAPRPAAVPPGERIYAIGDIHGRFDLLAALHERIVADRAARPHAGEATVVYLGDYVDRGPASRAVIDCLTGDPLPGFTAVHLLGNHEEAMLRFLEDLSIGPDWLSFGGEATLRSYDVHPPQGVMGVRRFEARQRQLVANLPPAHAAFLRGLRLSHEAGGYFFVHAGVRPGVALERQRAEDLLWIRETFLHSTADHGKVVVHGHTPDHAPQVRANRIGIDTGAFASGILTCLVLEGEDRRFLFTGEAGWMGWRAGQ